MWLGHCIDPLFSLGWSNLRTFFNSSYSSSLSSPLQPLLSIPAHIRQTNGKVNQLNEHAAKHEKRVKGSTNPFPLFRPLQIQTKCPATLFVMTVQNSTVAKMGLSVAYVMKGKREILLASRP
jgi:hypothetical protein